MFQSATDIFKSFLDGIRKTHTATVLPETFVRLWNEWAMPEWVASNVSLKEGVELSQKQIDDLANLRVIYDIAPYNAAAGVFKKPAPAMTEAVLDSFLQVSVASANVKRYLRAWNVMFQLNYGTDASMQECGLTGVSETWSMAKYMRSNMESVIRKSPYRKPKDSRLYYQVAGDYIKMVTDPESETQPVFMRLDFLRYPNEMSYSNGFSYTIDLPFYQLTEIIAIAVRLYLERVQSPRWQSFFQEEIARRVDKI